MAAITGLGALAAIFGGGQAAQAAPTSSIVYSVDGGATWSSNVTAAPGQTILTRVYYNNDTTDAINGTSVTTTIPAGFTLVPNSTTACLNPGTTDPTAPSGETVCSSTLTDAAIWPGGTSLTVSPTAGLFGNPTTDTVGIMAMGKTRYLNLQQCVYQNASLSSSFTGYVDIANSGSAFDAGTNTSNTAATSLSCGPGGSGRNLAVGNSGFLALDLLGNAYVNLQQCSYNSPTNSFENLLDISNGGSAFDTATNTSNTAATSLSCGAGASGYNRVLANSGFLSLDVLNNRYVNLQQCSYSNAAAASNYTNVLDISNSGTTFDAGTNASDTPATSLSCGPGGSGFNLTAVNSNFLALDTLDPSRGQGYIEFSMVAPSPPVTTTYPENVQLVGPGTGDPTGTGSITIDANAVPLADPAVAGAMLVAMAGAGWLAARRRRRLMSMV